MGLDLPLTVSSETAPVTPSTATLPLTVVRSGRAWRGDLVPDPMLARGQALMRGGVEADEIGSRHCRAWCARLFAGALLARRSNCFAFTTMVAASWVHSMALLVFSISAAVGDT
jgi:hypothetical protein